MREIKFRGKDILRNQWVYGLLLWEDVIGKIEYDCIGYETRKEYIVDKETIGQFTGLYDRNGKEIYEGDCFKDKYEDLIDVVVFERGCFCLKTYSWAEVCLDGNAFESKWGCWDLQPIYDYDLTKDEIIGNIYDNPELIKREEI